MGFVRERGCRERWTRAEVSLHVGFGRGGHNQEKRSGKQPADRNFVRRSGFWRDGFSQRRVASADVQSLGESILWRIDHERMLEFIGSNGTAGGQLCLNVASILSGRLVDGNKKVVDMGKELQASLAHLQQAASAGTQKDQALRQMQGKVANMQNAFKGAPSKNQKAIGSPWLPLRLPCLVPLD